jgi:branched-chain amino acid transport system substrate-binding protein
MKNLYKALVLAVLAALLLAACAPAAPATQAPATEEPMAEPTEEMAATEEPMAEPTEEMAATEEPMAMTPVELTIGFTASVTGSANTTSTRQVNGLNLFLDSVSDGFAVGDSMVTFNTVTYDDESTTDRVQELYTRLATEDNADFLISPYGSGPTDAAAVIAEQYGKLMITTGAASDATYQKGFTHVFQAYTPASRYLAGAVDELQSLDPSVTKIAFVYENSTFSTSVVTAARDYAESLGYETVLFEGYDPGTTDFAPFINKIEAAQPEAIMGGGHFEDGSAFARQLFEKGVSANYIALLVAPPEPTFSELGEAATGIVGPSQWEPQAEFTEEAANSMGLEWFGPTGADFTAEYEAAYGEEPSYHAAGGYVAGLILQKAMMDAGSTDPDAVLAALDNLDILTFYGHIKFDTSPENHGLQIGHDMVYIQWQGSGADLHKEVVWPLAGATADALYPIR